MNPQTSFIIGRQYKLKSYKKLYSFYHYYQYGYFNRHRDEEIENCIGARDIYSRKKFYITGYYDFRRIDHKLRITQAVCYPTKVYIKFEGQTYTTEIPMKAFNLFRSYFEEVSTTYQEEFEI